MPHTPVAAPATRDMHTFITPSSAISNRRLQMAAGAPPSSRRHGQRQSGSTRGDVTLTVRGGVGAHFHVSRVVCLCGASGPFGYAFSSVYVLQRARKARRWACAWAGEITPRPGGGSTGESVFTPALLPPAVCRAPRRPRANIVTIPRYVVAVSRRLYFSYDKWIG